MKRTEFFKMIGLSALAIPFLGFEDFTEDNRFELIRVLDNPVKGHLNSLQVKVLPYEEFVNFYNHPRTNKADAIYNPKTFESEGRLRFFGKMVNTPKKKYVYKNDLKIFCETLKEIKDNGDMGALLALPMSMELARYQNGKELHPCERLMLLCYFESDLPKGELNLKYSLDNDKFIKEGEVPNYWT